MAVIQRFERNTEGRDFVLGDLHGCCKTLDALLEKIHFDESKDRMFSVGDLVDRGPDSLQALLMTQYPWFHVTRGNHEEFICQYMAGKESALRRNHTANGGTWFYQLSPEEKQAVLDVVRALPFSLEIETSFGLVGVTHAGVLGSWTQHCTDWNDYLTLSKSKLEKLYHRTLWSRSRLRDNDTTIVDGAELVVVGHCPVNHPAMLGNVLYVDTGCGAWRWPAAWRTAGTLPALTAVELTQPLCFHRQERVDSVDVDYVEA